MMDEIALENNTEIDLDADGTPEKVAYELTEDDEGTGKFKITVGDAEITVDTYCGLKELYAGPGAVRKTLHKYTLAR